MAWYWALVFIVLALTGAIFVLDRLDAVVRARLSRRRPQPHALRIEPNDAAAQLQASSISVSGGLSPTFSQMFESHRRRLAQEYSQAYRIDVSLLALRYRALSNSQVGQASETVDSTTRDRRLLSSPELNPPRELRSAGATGN